MLQPFLQLQNGKLSFLLESCKYYNSGMQVAFYTKSTSISCIELQYQLIEVKGIQGPVRG